MSEKVKERAGELLESGEIKGFLALSNKYGHVGPHLFCDKEDLDSLVVGDRERPGDTRYSLNKQLINIHRRYQDATNGD